MLLVEDSQGCLGLSALSASSLRDMRLVLMRKGKTTEVEAGGCARRGVERSSCSSLCA